MARGWGRSEEDLQADKEQAQSEREHGSEPPAKQAELVRKRRQIDLSLAHVREELSKTSNPDRRRALEVAERDLTERLRTFGQPE